ncbi:hypothetical protein [Oleomonas cavernae]
MIAFARDFLDRAAPLDGASHAHAALYAVAQGTLRVTLQGGAVVGLAEPAQFAGFQGSVDMPSAILLEHNGLHFEIQVDRGHPIGKTDGAG